ncbi:hypothetical protein BH20GEM1_BH20GEM1_09180 [soil metagenome]
MLADAMLSAILNVVVLAGIPFLVYFLWHRLRRKRGLAEVARRAGLQVGEGLLPIVFGTSLFLGWARIRSESILGPWLVHAAANVATCLSVAARTAS